jgi:hypothetical protein
MILTYEELLLEMEAGKGKVEGSCLQKSNELRWGAERESGREIR